MRKFTLSCLSLATLFSPLTTLQASDQLHYNIVNLQAEASRKVSNDQMHATLYIEKSNKQPAQLASEINQLMSQAIATAKKYPQVKIETGSQNTNPIYDNDNRKLKEWRGRAQILLESNDFKATSQLISELQQNFQTQSIHFSVSESKRKKIEHELMTEASKNFQQRAQTLAQAWNKSSYQLVSLNLNNNNNYAHQDMARSIMPKAASASAYSIPEQDIATGESEMTVIASGSIQFK